MSTQRNSTHFDGEEDDAVPEGLTPQQEQAALLLASGVTVQEVADRLDMHPTTLWHWRKLETFQAYFNALRVEAKRNALNGVLSLQGDAIATISRLMTEGSDSTEYRAVASNGIHAQIASRSLLRRKQLLAFSGKSATVAGRGRPCGIKRIKDSYSCVTVTKSPDEGYPRVRAVRGMAGDEGRADAGHLGDPRPLQRKRHLDLRAPATGGDDESCARNLRVARY